MGDTVAIRGQLESSEPHPDFDSKYRVTFVLDEPGSSVLMHGTGSVLVVAIPPLDAPVDEGNRRYDAFWEMVDAAQREAQPDLDAIVDSRKTPLRGHWAGDALTEKNNDDS